VAPNIGWSSWKDAESEEEVENLSEHLCACCEEPIKFNEEIILLQGAYPHFDGEDIHYNMALDDDGEPDVMPVFMHIDCWDHVGETICEIREDTPPINEPGTIIECDTCLCSVRMGEKVVIAESGTFIQNPRGGGPKFQTRVITNILCLPCATIVSDVSEIESWVDINQQGECFHCTKAHCWRIGKCFCVCHVT